MSGTALTNIAREFEGLCEARAQALRLELTKWKAELVAVGQRPYTDKETLLTFELQGQARAVEVARKASEDVGSPTWSSPKEFFRKWSLGRELKAALALYEQELARLRSPQEVGKREARVKQKNADADADAAARTALGNKLTRSQKTLDAVTELLVAARDALAAVTNGAWLAPSFEQCFATMLAAMRQGQTQQAHTMVRQLVFQRLPSQEHFEHCARLARVAIEEARSQHAGFAVSGALPRVVDESINLAIPALSVKSSKALAAHSRLIDRWQELAWQIADPRALVPDPLWAIHWSAFDAAQSFTAANPLLAQHEDVALGEFAGLLRDRLSGPGAVQLAKFGYPIERSFVGHCLLASTPEETRLGADLGIIIDIHVGGLVCTKVALLQVKKAERGAANFGSKSGQLPKLIATPYLGYYLFFHQGTTGVQPPAPTVCSAQEISEGVTAAGKDIAAESLALSSIDTGRWDFSHFLSFGLCRPNSGVGVNVTSVDDAIRTLGAGHAGSLPKYLQVIAIADNGRVKTLKDRIFQDYEEVELHRTRKETDHPALRRQNGDRSR